MNREYAIEQVELLGGHVYEEIDFKRSGYSLSLNVPVIPSSQSDEKAENAQTQPDNSKLRAPPLPASRDSYTKRGLITTEDHRMNCAQTLTLNSRSYFESTAEPSINNACCKSIEYRMGSPFYMDRAKSTENILLEEGMPETAESAAADGQCGDKK